MFAAWWLPRFILQALRVHWQDHAAVLEPQGDRPEDARLLGVSASAEREGVHIGMTVSQAQARCPRLHLLYRDEKAEQSLQARLLHAAESWTPDYESTQPGLCVLDLTRSRLHEDWTDLGLQMHSDVTAVTRELRVGLADKADLAVLAAHIADPVRVIHDGRDALQELPLTVLCQNPDLLRLLHLWGVRTLGQYLALPKADIARRLGAEGLALHDLARGGKDRLLRLVRPPQVYHEEAELEAPIECLEPLMHLLSGMVGRLCARLAQAWRVAGSLQLQLRFEDHSAHQRQLRIAEPTRDESVLRRLLETSLESLKAAAPIVFVALKITPVRATSSQGSLFDQGLRDPNRFAETLSAIEALLGRGRVGRAELLPSRRTDAFRVVNFLEVPKASVPNTPTGLPLQRFRPPKPARLLWRDRRPVMLHLDHEAKPLIATSGPWFLSGEWWDTQQSWQHEIWDAATDDGTLYRLVRDQHVWRVEGRWG